MRLGTVRRSPHSIRKTEYASRNFFDLWLLPDLSPSEEMLREKLGKEDGTVWSAFRQRFQAQLKQPDKSHLLDVLAALSHAANF
ncbi:MAG: DUF488 family protein [Candidatus Omnitrophota bacterium]